MIDDKFPFLRDEIKESLKQAWSTSCYYLFMTNPDDDEERLATLTSIEEWYKTGVIAQTPFFNITMGYTLACNILPCSMQQLSVEDMQNIYKEEGLKAVRELISELREKI